ncbi:MAG TPA: hypothetical protein VKZ96_10555, partial [Thermomicrobiales bacterium]|nr:hypothetical protein [Thermomicrobiales bacterium]
MATRSMGQDVSEHEADGFRLTIDDNARQGWTVANGLAVGALAGLIASGVMLWVGREWGGSIVAQLIAERTTAELPLAAVRETLERLEENAKPAALVGITIGQVAAGALVAVLYSRFARRGLAGRATGALVLTLIAWLVLSFVAAPLGDIGVLALDAPLGTGDTQLGFVMVSAVYGIIVAALVPWPRLEGEDEGRRAVLRLAGLGALALPALWAARYVGTHANRLRTAADLDAG